MALALAQHTTMPIGARVMPIRRTASFALNKNFNGDGAVVSYLHDVRRTKQAIMKLRQCSWRLPARTDRAVTMSPVAMAATL
jgi:hypothetical protein